MKRTIISHDVDTGVAEVTFEHGGITLTETLDLKKVVPGSEYIFSQMEIDFDETYQLKALDKLTARVQEQIDNGTLTVPKTPETPKYEAPPAQKDTPNFTVKPVEVSVPDNMKPKK